MLSILKKINSIIIKIITYCFIFLIRIYQICISPFFTLNRCNFEPSCSHYTLEAIKIHGIFKGCYLGFRRIIKCTPNRQFTYDPVPPKRKKDSK